MLFSKNLEEIIFGRHNLIKSDELIIISGYVGPNPVERLKNLPFHSKVIYGMYGSDGIKSALHNTLLRLNKTLNNIKIFYSSVPVHSKCYVWKNKGEIVHALIGSANFSSNGLTTPFREILAETTHDSFEALHEYIDKVLNNCIDCREGYAEAISVERNISPDICRMTLLDPRTGEVQNANGLNWGQNPNNHTNQNDANIPIRADHIKQYPFFFPAKLIIPNNKDNRGRLQRHNDTIEIIWDDGISMEGLFEGNYDINDVVYPKQISSFPEKRILGEYFRNRIGVPLGARVTRKHLERYGRTHIDVSLLSEGIYYFDFSNGK